MNESIKTILNIKDITKEICIRQNIFRKTIGVHRALNKIDLKIYEDQILAILGEPGSGKSILTKIITKFIPPSHGKIFYKKEGEISSFKNNKLIFYRNEVRLINKSNFNYIEKNLKIEDLFDYYEKNIGAGFSKKNLLDYIAFPKKLLKKYFSELFVTDKERLKIGKSLFYNPRVIIFDDFANNLNIKETRNLKNLLLNLKKELKLTYVITSKNINILDNFVNKLAIMYLGNIIEKGPSDVLSTNPKHPYTKSLLSSLLQKKKLSNIHAIFGCNHHLNCANAKDFCKENEPSAVYLDENHMFKCFNPL